MKLVELAGAVAGTLVALLLVVLAFSFFGIVAFILLMVLIAALFVGFPITITRDGERIGYFKWGKFHRDGQ